MSISRRVVLAVSSAATAVASLCVKQEQVPDSSVDANPVVPLNLIYEIIEQQSWHRATYSSQNGAIAYKLRKRDEAKALVEYCLLHIDLVGYVPDRRHLFAAATAIENQRAFSRKWASNYVITKDDFHKIRSVAITRVNSISWADA